MRNNNMGRNDQNENAALLTKMLTTEQLVRDTAQRGIVYSLPLISKDGVPIIRRGTINVISGAEGSHKSRLAELFASLLIGNGQGTAGKVGFERIATEVITVAYLDTERSIKEEFPSAIKNILANSGLNTTINPENFRYTSLKNIRRIKRLDALKLFVRNIRKDTTTPIFIIIDVVTDGIKNFNDPEESMELMDFLSGVCDEIDATILLVIHLNPGSEKPRGHLGTEALNKAATVMQIGYERGNNEEIANYLSLKFVKLRHSQKLKRIPLLFDKDTLSLIAADQSLFQERLLNKDKKLTTSQVIQTLAELDGREYPQRALVALVREKFRCSVNTAKARLEDVANEKLEINGSRCKPCFLKINAVSGSPTIYQMENYQMAS
jgi:hypothetical protein